ncbi:MAG: MFS transporter [Candidatus Tectimicrobiota bacterium]|nr:MAG: MFS transporter [Candidatus Tectomicrobia bacterium]
MEATLRTRALRDSTLDGAFSAVMGSLTGGVFLTGFALKVLHAQPQQIGVLAALPTLANLVQLAGSYLVETTGQRKRLCLLGSVLSKTLWLLVLLLPLLPLPAAGRVWALVGILALTSLLSSLSGVAWMAWMSDLVPEAQRGTYFGKRNLVAAACGMAALLLGGKVLSLWEQHFGEGHATGFLLLFAAGIAAGGVSAWFLSRVPDLPPAATGPGFRLRLFGQPFRDPNFLTLTLFVAAWTFATQLAAPFYGVFMLEHLRADFSLMTALSTLATLANMLMLKSWGPIADRLGNKPVILVAGGVLAVVPFLWILAPPAAYTLPLAVAHALSGACLAGASLSQFNILLKLAPPAGRSVYIAVFNATVGLIGGLAPVVGGSLSQALQGFQAIIGGITLSNLHVLFLLSAALQLLALALLQRVQEAGAATPMAVIMQLRNDLDPQAGLASALDVAVVELRRTEGVLRRLDAATEALAARSEHQVARLVDRLAKPLKKLKDFLQES